MYKVFYNDRIVFFTDEFEKTFENNEGLFYKYKDRVQLSQLLIVFEHVAGIKCLYIYHPDPNYAFEEYKTLFSYIEAAGGLVTSPENKFLAIKRRGKWDLPKGKLEDNESPETGALREVEEECGISNLKVDQFITETYHTYHVENTPILKKTHWYQMRHLGNEKLIPQAEEEITEATWMTKNQVNDFTKNTFLSLSEVLKKGRLI